MAGRGPAPKDPATRRRRNVSSVPTITLTVDDQTRGPDLPDGFSWPEQTRRWWETWRKSPQAQAMTDTDWDFLLDSALLHAELWNGNGSVAAELRLRVAKFGATPEDRARLRIQVGETASGTGAVKPTSRYAHLRAVKPA
jgi:hypothetical protein